ncbi:MAG: hypothetical protein Q8S84_07430 [bacterium]|nr:hypothetical protein [bacterium]MDP3381279.1 hypothetical protein [bacterium]
MIGDNPVQVAINTFGFIVSFNTKFPYIHLTFIVSHNFIFFNVLHHLQLSSNFIQNVNIQSFSSTIEYALENSQSKSFNNNIAYCHFKTFISLSSFNFNSNTSEVSILKLSTFDKYHPKIVLSSS